jgi:hypothetical protein
MCWVCVFNVGLVICIQFLFAAHTPRPWLGTGVRAMAGRWPLACMLYGAASSVLVQLALY